MIDTALILPSRGLINSQTVEAIWPDEDRYNYMIPFFAHSLPLPQCFNEPIARALEVPAFKYIVIIEEDILPPEDWHWTLTAPLRTNSADLTFMDYMFVNGPVTMFEAGRIITGTGCMAMTRAAAEALMPFDSHNRYMLSMGRLIPFTSKLTDEEALTTYGQHDIDFWIRANDAGYRIKQVGRCDHLKVREYGQANVNNGFHNIERLTFDD